MVDESIGDVDLGDRAGVGIRRDGAPADQTCFMKPLVKALERAFARREQAGE